MEIQTLMKSRLCYINCDNTEVTLHHAYVVVPVSA